MADKHRHVGSHHNAKKRHSRHHKSSSHRLYRLNRLPHRRTLSESDVPFAVADYGIMVRPARSLDSWSPPDLHDHRCSSPAPSSTANGCDCGSSLKDSPVNALDADNVSEGGSIASDMFGGSAAGGGGSGADGSGGGGPFAGSAGAGHSRDAQAQPRCAIY